MDAEALLNEADALHDDQPAQAAAMLRRLDVAALPTATLPRCAFLFNHVFGERLQAWADGWACMRALAARPEAAASTVLQRQAAVAAFLAGALQPAQAHTDALARLSAAPTAQAQALVRLACTVLATSAMDAGNAAAASLAALSALHEPDWQQPGALDAAAAAQCSNLAATLAERPLADLAWQSLRDATLQAAELSQQLWLRCGTWVNHERACYGRAVAASAAGRFTLAAEQAHEGLRLLDAHDSDNRETVDRAFLLLELAAAQDALDRGGEARAARQQADALAAGFAADAGLVAWYRQRTQRLQQLLRR